MSTYRIDSVWAVVRFTGCPMNVYTAFLSPGIIFSAFVTPSAAVMSPSIVMNALLRAIAAVRGTALPALM